MLNHIENSLREAQSALEAMLANRDTLEAIEAAGRLLVKTYEQRGRVFSCGNGGSMCDAMHFAEELSGRFRDDRPALGATAISDASHMSCVGNDYGYEQVFSRYLEGNGRPGDCLIALSTSGSSKNIIRAIEAARAAGMTVVGLTGRTDAVMAPLCDIHICTPGGRYADRVQELHIKTLHILIELIERGLFPQNYGAQP